MGIIIKKPEYWEQAKEELSASDDIMAEIISSYHGESLVSRGDAFYSLMRSIVGQQISVKAADSIWNRVENLVNSISPNVLLKISDEDFRSIGLSKQKILYIKNLSESFHYNRLNIKNFPQMSDEEIIAELTSIKGIGKWTAEMFLIFHMMRPDIFPIKDIGLQKAIIKHYSPTTSPRKQGEGFLDKDLIEELSIKWAPWRSVATWYLWRSLDPVPVEY